MGAGGVERTEGSHPRRRAPDRLVCCRIAQPCRGVLPSEGLRAPEVGLETYVRPVRATLETGPGGLLAGRDGDVQGRGGACAPGSPRAWRGERCLRPHPPRHPGEEPRLRRRRGRRHRLRELWLGPLPLRPRPHNLEAAKAPAQTPRRASQRVARRIPGGATPPREPRDVLRDVRRDAAGGEARRDPPHERYPGPPLFRRRREKGRGVRGGQAGAGAGDVPPPSGAPDPPRPERHAPLPPPRPAP